MRAFAPHARLASVSSPLRTSGYLPQHRHQQLGRSLVCLATHYELLGVDAESSDDDIKTAFRQAAKRWHPDVNKEAGAERRFIQLNQAYTTLSDPMQRREYDQELRQKAMRAGQARGVTAQWGGSGNQWVEYAYVVVNADDDDSDDDDGDDDDGALLEDFLYGGNAFESSFQSSWQANGKKRRKQEAARAQQAAQQPSGANKGGPRRSKHGITDFDREEILVTFPSDMRRGAQRLFGRGLEGLETWEQLQDYINVLGAMHGSVDFDPEDFDSDGDSDDDDADDGWRAVRTATGRRASTSARPAAAGGRQAQGASSRPRQTPTGSPRVDASWAFGSSLLNWDALLEDFDTGSASASKARGRQQASPPMGSSGGGNGKGSRFPGSTGEASASSSRGSGGSMRGRAARSASGPQAGETAGGSKAAAAAASQQNGASKRVSPLRRPAGPTSGLRSARAASSGGRQSRHVMDSDDDDDDDNDDPLLAELLSAFLADGSMGGPGASRRRSPRRR